MVGCELELWSQKIKTEHNVMKQFVFDNIFFESEGIVFKIWETMGST